MSLKQRSSFVLFMHRFVPVLTVVLAVFSILAINLRTSPIAEAATNSTINFQARLQSASGAIVPDGNYNIEFKLYGASSGGTALWTEDHYNSGSNGLRTVNGYFSTKLGSVTAFPSTINWDQELWLTMNVGGTMTGTPTLDGEMDPRLKLTAVPYAISAGQLQTTNGSYTSKLGIQAPTGGDQVFQIQDQGAAGTYNILTAPSGSDGYIKLQTTTPGTAQTGNLNISGTGMFGTLLTGTIDAGSGNALTIGGSNATSVTIGAGSITTTIQGTASISRVLSGEFDSGSSSIDLNIGNANATTINMGTTSIARAINIGTGAAAQTVTIGSTNTSSSTVIQGGSNGVGVYAAGGGGTIGLYIGGNNVMGIDTTGRTTFKPNTDDTSTFRVQSASGSDVFRVQSSTGIVGTCGTCSLQSGTGGVSTTGALSFSGTAQVSYVTPGGASVGTKINIANFDPGNYGQVMALGIASGTAGTARVITVADGRTTAHQASIALLSPNENQIGGFSWDGSNTVFGVKTSSDYIDLINSGGTGARIGIASGKQTLELGQGGGTNGALQLNNNTNTNYTAIQATSVSASYITSLPTAIGTTGQCLGVASVSSPTQQLGYSDCLTTGTGVQLQASTPGTQQTGNLNISGTGIFGTAVSTALLTATGNTLVNNTSTTAFQVKSSGGTILLNSDTSTGTITLGSSGSGNYITFTAAGGLTAYGTSQHGKSIVYSPEYTNAVLDAASDSSCSSANNGTLSSAYDATNYRNYYNWTSTQGTNQCYDVVLDVTLPNDFSSWASSDPINLQALASNTSNAGYAIAIRNITGAAWDGNYGSGYASPGSISTSWSDVASSAFSGTYNAGDRLNIKIRMTAKSSANLQLGNLTLNYNSKW